MKYRNILAFALLFLSLHLRAQKELDSIVSASTPILFENPGEAVEIGKDLYARATEPETKANILMFISNGYLSKRQNGKSLEYSRMAYDMMSEIKNKKIRISILNFMGMQHQQLRIYDKANTFLDEALILTNSYKSEDSIHVLIGYNHTIRGFIYREQMNCQIALGYFDRAVEHFKASRPNLARSANLSTLHYNKGNCFLQTSMIDSARVNFEKSISYAVEADAQSLIGFAKKGLSEVYTTLGDFQKAIDELNEADTIAENVGDLILMQGVYENLSNNYLAIGNRDLYQFYDARYIETRNNLLKSDRKLVDESLGKSIESVKKEVSEKSRELNLLLIIVCFLLLIGLFLAGRMVIKSRRKFEYFRKQLNVQ